MSAAALTKPSATEPTAPSRHDWTALNTMTETERAVAASADPEARPMTEAERARAKRVPRIAMLRRKLGLSVEEFADRYHIPLTTVQDWEAGRSAPDAVGRAYLSVVAKLPEATSEAPR